MRLAHLAVALLSLSALTGFCAAGEPPSNAPPKELKKVPKDEIELLIKQLAGDEAKRTEARKKLEAIGEPALVILKEASEASDGEFKSTLTAIIETIENKLNGTLRVFVHKGRVNGVAISSDGKKGVSACWDGTLRYWNLENGELIRQMQGHKAGINSAALSPDGKRALSGGRDPTMRLWDLETGKEIRTLKHPSASVWDVAFSLDGTKALSGCSDGVVRVWELDSGKELLALAAQKGGVAFTGAFTLDGKQVVTGAGNAWNNPKKEGTLRLWDLTTGKQVRQFEGHTQDIRRVAISPDGKQLLSGSFDGTMRLWEIESGKELKCFNGPGNFVESVGFTPDGKKAICSYGPQTIETRFDEDPRCSLWLWDLNTGKELKRFKGHSAPVLSLALSADGHFLLSGSGDGTMRFWEIANDIQGSGEK